MVAQVKQETDPNKNYVYIIHEKQDAVIPSSMMWIKVGMLQASTVGDGDFYGRIRALNQGNPRGVEVAFSVMTHTRKTAAIIEDAVHRKLDSMQIPRRSTETNTAGHSEWFATDIATVQPLIEAEYAKYLSNLETDSTFFTMPLAKPVAKTRDKKVKLSEPALFGLELFQGDSK